MTSLNPPDDFGTKKLRDINCDCLCGGGISTIAPELI